MPQQIGRPRPSKRAQRHTAVRGGGGGGARWGIAGDKRRDLGRHHGDDDGGDERRDDGNRGEGCGDCEVGMAQCNEDDAAGDADSNGDDDDGRVWGSAGRAEGRAECKTGCVERERGRSGARERGSAIAERFSRAETVTGRRG